MDATCVSTAVEAIRQAVNEAEMIPPPKPKIVVDRYNPHQTVAELTRVLANHGTLYDRGVPVRLFRDHVERTIQADPLTVDGLVLMAHRIARPVAFSQGEPGEKVERDASLPASIARMYLDSRGDWQLPVLNGIASTPLLRDDGTIVASSGYDGESGMWVQDVPELQVAEAPTRGDAEEALLLVRRAFRTFCFADAATIEEDGLNVVDLANPPGQDESGFLNALLTAVCRPSLPLAPGILVTAASLSGAGAGKGLLTRCLSLIAFGREPHAVTGGASTEEMEKRMSAELIGGAPILFLDNLNDTALKSDLLASAITERPARIRILGQTRMATLNSSALVVLTGNGLSVSEDLARRFIAVDLDPRTEHPEARPFRSDLRREILSRRLELVGALLTIWRWGRRQGLPNGRPLGSFDAWGRWVRDPLLALGCCDPAERIRQMKRKDARRESVAEVFEVWWRHHADRPVAIRELHEDVLLAVDPVKRSRQALAARVRALVGTRLDGLRLVGQAPVGRWGAWTYTLAAAVPAEHRDHRGHRVGPVAKVLPTTPMPPMLSEASVKGNACGFAGLATAEEIEWAERAAIIQYDGGLSREDAEALARAELLG